VGVKDGMEDWPVGALEAGLPKLEAKGAQLYEKATCSSPTLATDTTASDLNFLVKQNQFCSYPAQPRKGLPNLTDVNR
jgi:hypothetical protein